MVFHIKAHGRTFSLPHWLYPLSRVGNDGEWPKSLRNEKKFEQQAEQFFAQSHEVISNEKIKRTAPFVSSAFMILEISKLI